MQRRDDNLPRQHAGVEDDGRGHAAERRVLPARGTAAHAGRRTGRAAPHRDRPRAGQARRRRVRQPRQPQGLRRAGNYHTSIWIGVFAVYLVAIVTHGKNRIGNHPVHTSYYYRSQFIYSQ